MSDYAWVKLGDGREVYRRVRQPEDSRRGSFPAPMVMNDHCEVKSMVDGQVYTSKAALRKSYRENGYIEVGNEKQEAPKPKEPDRKAIRESVGKALSRAGIPA